MTTLTNAASAPYFQTNFPAEITIAPVSGINDYAYKNKIDDQLYLPIKRNELIRCLTNLRKLFEWQKNWDGYDAEKPKKNAIENAIALLRKVFEISYNLDLDWISPNITADSCGDIMLEWWGKNDKKITLYINEDMHSIEYIKSSNDKIQDMEQSVIHDINVDSCQKLFGWLNG